MYLLEFNMCIQPGVLTCFLLFKYFIILVKIIVPLLLMYSTMSKVFQHVISGEEPSKFVGPVLKSLIASFAVFFAPTIINYLIITLTNYSDLNYEACVTNATVEKIKELKEAELRDDLEKYNNPQNFDVDIDYDRYRDSHENPEGAVSNASGIWKESVFPLPNGSTTCRSSVFGPRKHPITGEYNNHSGDDYPASCGTSVYAVLDGQVTEAANDGGYHYGMGNYVKIKHSDGSMSIYMHSSNVLVKAGQTVKKGQEIMKVGTTGSSTGCHLHITIKDTSGNNVAPTNYIPTLPAC